MARRSKPPGGADAWDALEYWSRKREDPEQWAALAQGGDLEMAQEILRWVAFHALYDFPFNARIPESMAYYVNTLLRGLAADPDALRKALRAAGLLPNQYQWRAPDYWKMARDADLALCVEQRRKQYAETIDEAVNAVADSYVGLSRRAGAVGSEATRKAYLRYFPAAKDSGKR